MTVAAIAPTITYLENGATLSFAVPFQFLEAADLVVTRFGPDAEEDIALLGSDYSVSGGAGSTGTVLMAAAKASGWKLRIQRATARSQPTDYTPGDNFPAESHERALDRNAMCIQEVGAFAEDTESRAVRVPRGEAIEPLPPTETRVNKYLKFDYLGNPGLGDGGARGVPGASFVFGVFAELSTLPMPEGTRRIYSSGHTQEGIGAAAYDADDSVDPAYAAAHPRVAGISEDGQGWRLSTDQFLSIPMFGALPGADIHAAQLAAQLYGIALTEVQADYYRPGLSVHVPTVTPAFTCSATIVVFDSTFTLWGDNTGMAGDYRSKIRWTADVPCIIIQGESTDGLTGETGTGYSAAGSAIKGLFIEGFPAARGNSHGITLRARADVSHNRIRYCSGHGVASLGNNSANTNSSRIHHNRIERVGKSAVFTVGQDGNVAEVFANDASFCGDYAWELRDFLGGLLEVCSAESCGEGQAGPPGYLNGAACSLAGWGGDTWFVMRGKATEASTTQPGTDPTVWGHAFTGGDGFLSYPHWTSGTPYRDGGLGCASDDSNYWVVNACYGEPDMGPFQANGNCIGMGGHMESVGMWIGRPFWSSRLGVSSSRYGWQDVYLSGTSERVSQIGGEGLNGTLQVFASTFAGEPSATYRWKYNTSARFVLDRSNSLELIQITGNNTTEDLGTGVAQPDCVWVNKLHLGASFNGSRLLTFGTLSGNVARGDAALSNSPSAGGSMGEVCTIAGVVGSTAVVKAMPNLAA
jgi:hypothetical protein